jgi:hypothetical protein
MKMDFRRMAIIAAVIAAAILAYRYWMSPERQIKKVLSQAEAAFEAKDIDGVMAHVSLQYRDDQGLAYLNLKELIKRGFDEFEGFDVRLGNLRVELSDDGAAVPADLRLVVVHNGEKAYLLGNDAEPVAVEFHLAREALKWKIRAINGVRVPDMGF